MNFASLPDIVMLDESGGRSWEWAWPERTHFMVYHKPQIETVPGAASGHADVSIAQPGGHCAREAVREDLPETKLRHTSITWRAWSYHTRTSSFLTTLMITDALLNKLAVVSAVRRNNESQRRATFNVRCVEALVTSLQAGLVHWPHATFSGN